MVSQRHWMVMGYTCQLTLEIHENLSDKCRKVIFDIEQLETKSSRHSWGNQLWDIQECQFVQRHIVAEKYSNVLMHNASFESNITMTGDLDVNASIPMKSAHKLLLLDITHYWLSLDWNWVVFLFEVFPSCLDSSEWPLPDRCLWNFLCPIYQSNCFSVFLFRLSFSVIRLCWLFVKATNLL